MLDNGNYVWDGTVEASPTQDGFVRLFGGRVRGPHAKERRLRYAPGHQTREPAVCLQVGFERQLQDRNAIQVDPIVFDFAC